MDWLCKLKDRPKLLLLLALGLLFFLFLCRRWLWGWFVCYLALLAYLGALVLVRLIQGRLRKQCWKSSATSKGAGSEGHPPSTGIYVPPHTYKRPDPMIYSQLYLLQKGLAVIWDNPDIQLFDGPSPISSHELKAGKTYNIRAQVLNGSTDAPAVNVAVRFYYLSFGIGTVRNYIGQTFVNVPVKGSSSLPALVNYPWTTPGVAGHYCLQVELLWSDDANPNNNLGQENVDVQKLNSPNANFQFVLRNESLFRRELQLKVDGYSIPPKLPCEPRAPTRAEAIRLQRDPYARHRRDANPVPDGWKVDFQGGDRVTLDADEERLIKVHVTAPDGFVGRQAINVNAFDGDEVAGGVTLFAQS